MSSNIKSSLFCMLYRVVLCLHFLFFCSLHVLLSSLLFFALWFTWDVYLLEAFCWWVVAPISRGPTSYPSFCVYKPIWWSFSECLSTTSHIPWRTPMGMYFRWGTCTNRPWSVLSKANWYNHGVEKDSANSSFGVILHGGPYMDWPRGKRKYETSMLAIIFWDKLDDFIKGEQHHSHSPCK